MYTHFDKKKKLATGRALDDILISFFLRGISKHIVKAIIIQEDYESSSI